MELRFNVTGDRRKQLVAAITEVLGTQQKYLGAPTFAYDIGNYRIDREGTLIGPYNRELAETLATQGFEAENTTAVVDGTPAESFTVEVPLEGFSNTALANLGNLVEGKRTLLQKALSIDTLAITPTDGGTLRFAWFPYTEDADEIAAYTQLVIRICMAAKTQKRVIAREKRVDNEKFAMRTWLVRLGMVGNDFKSARKILLRNLSGNSAFRNGAPLPKATVTAVEMDGEG